MDRWAGRGEGSTVAMQPWATSRPVYRSGEGEAFLRFDGKDDFLHVSGPARSEKEVTVFVLAAPSGNPGNFSALFSMAQAGRNDYTSGLNLDLGPGPTLELSVLNVESAGSAGFVDLLQPTLEFAGFHVFTVRSRVGSRGTELFLDGLSLGTRARSESRISVEEIIVGGRMYSNDPAQPPYAQGCFQGDIAGALVYGRALDDSDRERVEQSLRARVAALNALASGRGGHALEPLLNPPLVQMLVPGFTVHELPMQLRNQVNVRYRPDGKVFALGYDGRIQLLSDSDGDGLEDAATVFWDKAPLRGPIGMALLPKDDPRGDGVYVASKAKLSLILDEDRDGAADKEIVVADGWKETLHGVDTLGVAVDPLDGAVYFSIGCENFANGYLLDAAGESQFKLASERGTIQRVAPDFSHRETVCTGVRFACALAFNQEGDLFATDQEGATWLPNGNPLDELLEIVPGRHYGFPPRHPRHLPGVIDEPPIMEYGPQHQSTVGMVFNEGVNGGPFFGPAHWRHDALICGESRGKLYRTKLVKTHEGYVAQNHLIACLGMLTIDACVSPHGDLLVACHSGPPDWGTGPTGTGKLFKIRYARPEVPQPVWAWAAAADEFRIAFDRPLRLEEWAGAKEKIRIEAGPHVSAGDRYEMIRPGYQVVRDQMGSPRRWVELQSLSVAADRRTLILHVPSQTEPVTYAMMLPVPPSWEASGGITQRAEMDVALTLNGVEAFGALKVVLPHPSIEVARGLTAGSADHERFYQELIHSETRQTRLRGLVDPSNLFVPAVQPGAQLDWDIAADPFANETMVIRKAGPPPADAISLMESGGGRMRGFDMIADHRQTSPNFVFALGARERPIPSRRLFVPWTRERASEPASNAAVRADVTGHWLRGRRLFFGEAGCSTCHSIRGEGIAFGPDLSNLIFRDRDSVMEDIVHPSAAINPDHIGTTVRFNGGLEVNGLVTSLNEQQIIVRLPANVEMRRPRQEVVEMRPMETSLMPENLGDLLPMESMEDLLAFLLVNPLAPAPIARVDPPAPPPRDWAEIAPLFPPRSASAASPATPLRVLLSDDEKDHGLDEHNYPLWLERWTRLLGLAEGVTLATCRGFPSPERLASADVAVFYSRNSGWNTNAAKLLDTYQARGGGLVYLHWGIEGGNAPDALADRIGLAFSASRFRHGEMDLIFRAEGHPITQDLLNLHFTDESYWGLRGEPGRVLVLADSVEEEELRPQLWVMERGAGRVFACIPGHFTWTLDDPLYRLIVLRGIAWAARQENIDRFAELALVGARVKW